MAQRSIYSFINEFGTIITANGTSSCGMVASFVIRKQIKKSNLIISILGQVRCTYCSQYGYGIPNFSLALTRGDF
jgi:hypothetical protein